MKKRPNILLCMVDEQRYPTVYDGPVLRAWMDENLPAQRLLRNRGVEFHRHYAQSTACAPSRTSFFTGQYPTLHGVSQTDGIGKTASATSSTTARPTASTTTASAAGSVPSRTERIRRTPAGCVIRVTATKRSRFSTHSTGASPRSRGWS